MAALTKPARVVSQSLLRLQSDARLAQLARDGHTPAFETLVERYRPELVRASTRIVGPDRSEDAVQQALLNAHRAIETTKNVQNLRAWLHRIAQNSSLNILRSVRDEVTLEHHPNMATAVAGPADSAELSERLTETFAAIDALPEHQRAALLLRELEGRSHKDIAAVLGVSAGAARQHLMRARQGVRSAVTALTPYPLIAALASPGGGSGLAELIFGAGTSATALKLGASVAATGAIAGGVFGASAGVTPHKRDPSQSRTTTTSQPLKQSSGTVPPATSTTNDHGGNSSKGKVDDDSRGHGSGKDDAGHDNSGKGGDDAASQPSRANRGPGSGSTPGDSGSSGGSGFGSSSGSNGSSRQLSGSGSGVIGGSGSSGTSGGPGSWHAGSITTPSGSSGSGDSGSGGSSSVGTGDDWSGGND